MTASVSILIPVLDRPHRVAPLLESLEASSPPLDCRPRFVCSPSDVGEISAVIAADLPPLIVGWDPGRGDYARKMNFAFESTEDEWVFLGADDLRFRPGWLDRALDAHERYHACVIGTNDLGNSNTVEGQHSTHTLVNRRYGECGTIDGPELLHPGYWHNFVDNEFVQTALHRETFFHATDSLVEHLHPNWGKASNDGTYILGQEKFEIDRAHFNSRRHLWGR